ncbi:MAG: Gp49 family protein [Telluria sp.]
MQVTREAIEARIENIRYARDEGSTTTVCHLTLDNGFEQVGTSACVDPAAFKADYGRKLAYEDAFRHLYTPMAFLLLEAKHQAANTKTFGNALKAMKEGKRVMRLDPNLKPHEIYIADGVMHVAFVGGDDVLDCIGSEAAIAEDWVVL